MTEAHYTLMNKDVPVLSFDYSFENHKATRITRLHETNFAPLGLHDKRNEFTTAAINKWWRNRAIPPSRAQIDRLLENLQLDSTLVLAEKSFGLSLSDRYWLNDDDNPKRWEDINFFDNDFTDDLGFLTLGQDSTGSSPDAPDYLSVTLSSPNSTLGGDLLKKWKIIDGRRVLLKAGVGVFNQEPYNEVIATELHRRLMNEGEYLPYELFEDSRRVYSACENMLNDNEELVPAWDLISNMKQPNHLSDLAFYVKRCEDLELDPDAVIESLAKMFVADFILANRDRHYRNFGIIRNVNTLQDTRLAPVFDSGSCLWSNAELLEAPIDFEYRAKPFKYQGMKPADQVKLFKGHLEWLNLSALEGFPEVVAEILSKNPNITERRIETVSRQVARNIEVLSVIVR